MSDYFLYMSFIIKGLDFKENQMKIASRYSKSFYSDRLSDTKYREIYDFAVFLNEIRNEISQKVNSNLLFFLDMSKFDFQTFMLPEINDRVPSNFNKRLLDDVFISYENKFDWIKRKLKFEYFHEHKFNFYKRNTKDHKSGDLKSITKKRKDTNLSRTLTYLARYGNDNTLNYLNEKFMNEIDSKKKNFYSAMLDCIHKFGFDRLLKLAISKRERIVKHYSEHPIKFTSLSFRGRSRLSSDIVSYNENFNSIINSFVNLSWNIQGRKKLTIPVKYSKDFHKEMKRYTNGRDTSYTLCFDGDRVRIVLSYADDREIPENKTNFVGTDVNSKHNLFQCSNGERIDFDRELVEVLSKEMLKIDELKKNKDYAVGKRKANKINHLERELHSKIRESIAGLCKSFNSQGFDHVIFENLTGFEEKCFCRDENDLNYNRRVKLLKLSSLKDEFEHISRKYDIAVSLVQSCYTSQACNQCGCIDRENRKSQEEFECVECGFRENADLNASMNILKRLASTVLRSELLKKCKIDNGTFEPRPLKRDEVKKILLSHRYSLEKDKEAVNSA